LAESNTSNFNSIKEIHSSKYAHGQEKTRLILEAINKIAGQKIADITYLKCLSIASAKLSFPHLNIIHCSPSGHFKTWSSKKASEIMPKKWSLPLKSDFTIHSLYEENKTKEGIANVNGKCFLINDATLLFSSKGKQTKQRLVNGLAELMTDEEYKYGDFSRHFIIKGQISVILNITTESYNQNLKNLLGNTFDERCLTLHSELSQKEFNKIKFHYSQEISGIPYTIYATDSLKKVEITIPTKFEEKIQFEASEYSWKSVKGYPRNTATIKALLRANAFLNGRIEVCESDFFVVDMAKNYLINPLQPNKPRIIQMLRNNQTVSEICKALDKDYDGYKSYVYRCLNDAKAKGLLS
jgi:hypothetical protein